MENHDPQGPSTVLPRSRCIPAVVPAGAYGPPSAMSDDHKRGLMLHVPEMHWQALSILYPPEKKLVFLAGPSGYCAPRDWICQPGWYDDEYRPPIGKEKRWLNVAGDAWSDAWPAPTHWTWLGNMPKLSLREELLQAETFEAVCRAMDVIPESHDGALIRKMWEAIRPHG
jgi:hypothetical protein